MNYELIGQILFIVFMASLVLFALKLTKDCRQWGNK